MLLNEYTPLESDVVDADPPAGLFQLIATPGIPTPENVWSFPEIEISEAWDEEANIASVTVKDQINDIL